MLPTSMGPLPNENGALQGAVGGQSEQAKTAVGELSFPASTSVKGHTLADLLTGAKITHMDVWKRHGSSRAAHHVFMLRKAGWPVVTEEIDAPTSDRRTARIALYSLPAEAIAAAGEAGQKYVDECAHAETARRAA